MVERGAEASDIVSYNGPSYIGLDCICMLIEYFSEGKKVGVQSEI